MNLPTILIIAALIAYAVYRNRTSKVALIKGGLKKAEWTSIKNFTEGNTTKIIGRILPVPATLEAPLSGRACVLYHVVITEESSDGENSSTETILNDLKSCDIFIGDHGGLAQIVTEPASIHLTKVKKYKTSLFNSADERMKSYLDKHGIKETILLSIPRSLKFHERILEVGDEIAVSGQGRWKETSDPAHKAEFPNMLLMQQTGQTPLYISDDPKTFK